MDEFLYQIFIIKTVQSVRGSNIVARYVVLTPIRL